MPRYQAVRMTPDRTVMTTFRPVPKSHGMTQPPRTLLPHDGEQPPLVRTTCTGHPSWPKHSLLLACERVEHPSPSRQSTCSPDVKRVLGGGGGGGGNGLVSVCSYEHPPVDMIWLPRLSSTISNHPPSRGGDAPGKTGGHGSLHSKSHCNTGRLPRQLTQRDGARSSGRSMLSTRQGLSPIISSGDTEIVSETSSTSGSFTLDGIRHTHDV